MVAYAGVLDNPCEEAGRVIEVEADVVGAGSGSRGDGFGTCVLELGNKVFVCALCEASSFFGI